MEIITHIAAKWRRVGIQFNFDPTGHTIDLIEERRRADPEACCTDMMMEWLGGRGKKPTTWATLVKILRNAEFSALADDMEQVVPSLVKEWNEEEQ